MSAAPAPQSLDGRVALRSLIARPSWHLRAAGSDSDAFDLYSLAAFGRGQAEAVPGAQLRGKLLRVHAGDVLLSRATGEPRRAWVVGEHAGRAPIASNEWLVLRPGAHDAGYLRHLLVSNEFHLRFMRSLAGVRRASAASARLGAIDLPLPSRSQQQASVQILDRVEDLRARRRLALAALDDLAAALYERVDGERLAGMEPLRQRMNASRIHLDALLGVLRDLAFRGELASRQAVLR